VETAAREGRFEKWYAALSAKLGISRNPDDPEHYYDLRGFHRDMEATAALPAGDPNKILAPDAPGGHFPSTYKLPGHPRTYLDDTQGRVFDTRSNKYLTGDPVSPELLKTAEGSPDLPGFDPQKAIQVANAVRAMGRR
jgi:hypothetical protein